jgi:hypothetical protein
MSSFRPLVAVLTVLAGLALGGCGQGEIEDPSEFAPASSPAARPSCASVAYPTVRTTEVTIAKGECVSFERYSDITAVLTGVDVVDKTMFDGVHELTYRALLVGSAVMSVHTKREICSASATCQVINPVKDITVTVTAR